MHAGVPWVVVQFVFLCVLRDSFAHFAVKSFKLLTAKHAKNYRKGCKENIAQSELHH